MVNYQGDLYMGIDEARYEVTKYPEHVDALGVLQTGKVPTFDQTADSLQEQDGRSNRLNDPGTHTSHFNQHLEELFQDNPLQEVFCDSQDVYYATTKLPHLQFIVQHVLMLERQTGHESRIIDKFGNYYRTLEWSEVRDLTWKGRKLFLETHPTHTERIRLDQGKLPLMRIQEYLLLFIPNNKQLLL